MTDNLRRLASLLLCAGRVTHRVLSLLVALFAEDVRLIFETEEV